GGGTFGIGKLVGGGGGRRRRSGGLGRRSGGEADGDEDHGNKEGGFSATHGDSPSHRVMVNRSRLYHRRQPRAPRGAGGSVLDFDPQHEKFFAQGVGLGPVLGGTGGVTLGDQGFDLGNGVGRQAAQRRKDDGQYMVEFLEGGQRG